MGEMQVRDRDQDSYRAYVIFMVVLVVAEGLALHLWLGRGSIPWTVGLGLFHLAALALIIADARAVARATGWTFDGERLRVDLGWRARGEIPIAAVERVEEADARTRANVRAHLAGFPELLLVLREPVVIRVRGRARSARTVSLAVADPAGFADRLGRTVLRPPSGSVR